MADYPFNLRGKQESFSGWGSKDGESYKSREFTLTQGIVIAEIEHYGQGDFNWQFFPTELTGADVGFLSAVGAGAAIGSVVPVAGTITGGLLGAGVGWLVGEGILRAVGVSKKWGFECKGEIDTLQMIRVKKDEDGCLTPGNKYRLEVGSKSKWACRFIQPDLGQSFGSLVADAGEADDDMDAGFRVIGPLTSGTRPLLANIRHKGGGEFYAAAYSVDGTHECILHHQEGQFHVEDVRTELKPGKEYVLYVGADGNWNLRFTEGY